MKRVLELLHTKVANTEFSIVIEPRNGESNYVIGETLSSAYGIEGKGDIAFFYHAAETYDNNQLGDDFRHKITVESSNSRLSSEDMAKIRTLMNDVMIDDLHADSDEGFKTDYNDYVDIKINNKPYITRADGKLLDSVIKLVVRKVNERIVM